jgi:hypothetical protein
LQDAAQPLRVLTVLQVLKRQHGQRAAGGACRRRHKPAVAEQQGQRDRDCHDAQHGQSQPQRPQPGRPAGDRRGPGVADSGYRLRVSLATQSAQVDDQLVGALVAVVDLLLETLAGDALQLGRRRGVVLGEGLGVISQDGAERVGDRRPVEGQPPREHLVQHHAVREDVGAVVHREPARLLGRHERGRSQHAPVARHLGGNGLHLVAGLVRVLAQLGQPEVEDLDVTVWPDDHVVGLEVTVDYVGLVSPGHRLGDLDGVAQGVTRRQGLPGDAGGQRLALHQFHGDEDDALDLVNRGDVRVGHRCRGASLAQETDPPFLVGNGVGAQHLEGNLPAELLVLGAVDHAHAAFADLVENAEVGKSLSDHASSPRGQPQLRRSSLQQSRNLGLMMFIYD